MFWYLNIYGKQNEIIFGTSFEDDDDPRNIIKNFLPLPRKARYLRLESADGSEEYTWSRHQGLLPIVEDNVFCLF